MQKIKEATQSLAEQDQMTSSKVYTIYLKPLFLHQ